MAWSFERSGTKDAVSLVMLAEDVLGDSDKVLDFDQDVPANERMEILAINVVYQASAQAGNRIITIEIIDAAANTYRTLEFEKRTMQNDLNIYEAAPGLIPTTSTLVFYETLPVRFFIFQGQTMRIRDNAAIDATNDDMRLRISGRLF